METHLCHFAHVTHDLTTTAQQHAQCWCSDGSSRWVSYDLSVSWHGHPQYTGAVTMGGCGWPETRLKSPAPQGVSTLLVNSEAFFSFGRLLGNPETAFFEARGDPGRARLPEQHVFSSSQKLRGRQLAIVFFPGSLRLVFFFLFNFSFWMANYVFRFLGEATISRICYPPFSSHGFPPRTTPSFRRVFEPPRHAHSSDLPASVPISGVPGGQRCLALIFQTQAVRRFFGDV